MNLSKQVSELSELNSNLIKINSNAICKIDLLKHQNMIMKTTLIQFQESNSKQFFDFKKLFRK